MSDANFQLHGVRDPRLAVHATSSMPAWLWSADGAHVLWANAVAAKIFGARSAADLASKIFSPADRHRRQVVQLAARMSPSVSVRAERLRGFGAPLAGPITCMCARLSFENSVAGILVVAAESSGRHAVSPSECIAYVLDSIARPALAFKTDGTLAASNDAAKILAPHLGDLRAAGLDAARDDALRDGKADLKTNFARGTLYRVGSGHDSVLIALFDAIDVPEVAPSEPPQNAGETVAPPAGISPEDIVQTTPAPAPVETVAQNIVEPPPAAETPPVQPSPAYIHPDTRHVAATLADMDGPHVAQRRHPLRFMWQMDSDGRFSLGSDEFTRLIGTRTAAAFGRLWSEIADALSIDPNGEVAAAIATRATWSGITVNWPSDDAGGRLPVELSGLPVFDRARNFLGYRGFGVCRDLEGLAQLAAQRREEMLYSVTPPRPDNPPTPPPTVRATAAPDTRQSTDHPVSNEVRVDTPVNVVPFRPANEPKPPALTAVESSAFDELARRLSAGLEHNAQSEDSVESVASDEPDVLEQPPAAENPAAFLQPETAPPRAGATQDTQLLDRLPLGVLVYRLDRLIYANRAFLTCTGFSDLHQLTEAGGLDALYVEPSTGTGASTTESGTPVTISALAQDKRDNDAAREKSHDARLFTVTWDGEPAMALMFSGARTEPALPVAPVAATPFDDSGLAEDLSTILDTTAEGIVMFDGLGRIQSCNRSAEALFGRGDDISTLNLIDLFAPESQREVLDCLENAKNISIASLLDHGREVLGHTRDGRTMPLSMTIGRTRPDSPRFFAVFRDLTQARKSESDIRQAQRQAERATTARSDVLTRISHEVRTPLNAIIGFADVMIEERFGALGNERYGEYMKDIRASGQRVMAIIDDLLDLSRIESGSMELAFANQDLNSLVEQCVAAMQPHANRERIIIRTSLAHALPNVKADARALRQITLNLIGSSIHLANAGGQVIVSTATTDFGDIVLRVRDTGHGLNDNEIAAAMAPFRSAAAMDQLSSDDSTISLSLTKALVEANRAKFQIKSAAHSGTLIEVLFSHASAIA